ncbi:MAG: GntR family transcriptional regulator [Paramuribaculum sp.]|nr:GntR family transcriptional regulator [Paramuribaculum sp.]MDE6587003.1 GntR family transcriptional regulator [Paramuribaculum sp.]MDE7237209.1 GntR family transcriptional regulator [Paramuribaculum sp.]
MDLSPQSSRPIYLRIVDDAMNRILSGAWRAEERIPSVRELSVELSVNTHTVLKAFDLLSDSGIIASRRGMGYFLTPEARDKVYELRRREFYDSTLPELASNLKALGISLADLEERLKPLL